jgi:hypothetical protein
MFGYISNSWLFQHFFPSYYTCSECSGPFKGYYIKDWDPVVGRWSNKYETNYCEFCY